MRIDQHLTDQERETLYKEKGISHIVDLFSNNGHPADIARVDKVLDSDIETYAITLKGMTR